MLAWLLCYLAFRHYDFGGIGKKDQYGLVGGKNGVDIYIALCLDDCMTVYWYPLFWIKS